MALFCLLGRGRERQKGGQSRRFCLLGQRPSRQSRQFTCAGRAAPGPCYRQDRMRGPRHPRLQRVLAACSGLPPSTCARRANHGCWPRACVPAAISASHALQRVTRRLRRAPHSPLSPSNSRGPRPPPLRWQGASGSIFTLRGSSSAAPRSPPLSLSNTRGPRPPPLRWQWPFGPMFTLRGSSSAAPRSPPLSPSPTRGGPDPQPPLRWVR